MADESAMVPLRHIPVVVTFWPVAFVLSWFDMWDNNSARIFFTGAVGALVWVALTLAFLHSMGIEVAL